jgi:hypothetical protein
MRKQYAWIKARVEEGRTVYLSTYTHRTKITSKNLNLVKATKTGLMVQMGKRWVDHSLTEISAI